MIETKLSKVYVITVHSPSGMTHGDRWTAESETLMPDQKEKGILFAWVMPVPLERCHDTDMSQTNKIASDLSQTVEAEPL